MTFTKEKLAQLDTFLNQAKSVVITAHKSPDGDSVGSSLGLKNYLQKLGINATVCHPDPAPDFLWWMPAYQEILNYEEHKSETEAALLKADLIFCLDYNSAGRIGKLDEILEKSTAKRVMIDHHRDPDENFCDLIFSDPTNSSTSQMIFELAEAQENLSLIDSTIGSPLYCGIVMDTGSFRFPSTSEKTFLVAAALKKAGVKHWEIHEAIYDNNTENKIRMTSYALLQKLVILEDYRTSYLSLDRSEQEQYQAKKGDTEGLVNQALGIKGISMAVFMKEADGLIKMSFRSKGGIPVNDLARDYFGGGGHKNAAGGRFIGKIQDAIAKFEEVLPLFFEKNKEHFS
ncbi:MAG: bifunctional oligoribonuclease/PAP phosphatase NrnA [Flavobacteriales bacterium]|nr:bifunctional oligoribonuclease/PAP phosphatase NrnA [Flavobacteriales bacterium]